MKVYSIELKKYKKGYCPTICRNSESAEKERKSLELNTGLEWKIRVTESN